MKSRVGQALCAVILVLSMAVPAGAGGGGAQKARRKPAGKTHKDAGPTDVVRFHFEALEVELSKEQTEQINGATDAVSLDALAAEGIKAGEARVLQVFDVLVAVGEPFELTTGSRVPLVQGKSVTKDGATSTSVSYEAVGCILEGKTDWAWPRDQGRLAVALQVEIRDLRESGVMLTDDIPAQVFVEFQQELETAIPLDTQVHFFSLQGQTAGAAARLIVYRLRASLVADE